jgi:cytoplasmic iron level regulating protein YaaA (DUF328/UPF0246 family)
MIHRHLSFAEGTNMIVVLSPSKSMQTEAARATEISQPEFLDQAEQLVSKLRKFSEAELSRFMKISPTLAQQTHQRFQKWARPFTPDNANPAALTFTGAVYDGLDATSLDKNALQFAQDHLRIFSALYGVLRPLDLMQAYRLDMADPLETDSAPSLYAFWKSLVTNQLNQLAGSLLINLASQEYFKVIDKKRLDKQIVAPVFKDEKNGKLKTISLYAKRARGAMARFIIEKRISSADELLAFNRDGYTYAPDLSAEDAPVFTRPEPA